MSNRQSDKFAYVQRTLRETYSIMQDTVKSLVLRQSLLEDTERRTAEMAHYSSTLEERSRALEVHRQCTLACVALVVLTLLFLFLVFASYLTQH